MHLSKPDIPPDSTLRASTSWTRAPMGLTDIPKPSMFKTRQLSQNLIPHGVPYFSSQLTHLCCLVNAQSQSFSTPLFLIHIPTTSDP